MLLRSKAKTLEIIKKNATSKGKRNFSEPTQPKYSLPVLEDEFLYFNNI